MAADDGLRKRRGKDAGEGEVVPVADVEEGRHRTSRLSWLFEPVDNSSLVLFRILWGVVLMYVCYAHYQNDFAKLDCFVEWAFVPKYSFAPAIQPLSREGFRVLWCIMAMSSVGVTAGALYRLSTAAFLLCFTYIHLLDSSSFVNHNYLQVLVLAFMAAAPANAALSVDAWIWPSLKSTTMAAWVLYLLRFQQVIVYLFAAIAKLNVDWLRGQPMYRWLFDAVDRWDGYVPKGKFTAMFCTPLVALFISYAGVLFDGFISFPLLFAKGWVFAMAVLCCVTFHTLNKLLFGIGFFPAFMILLTTFFFDPGYARRWLPWLFGPPQRRKRRSGRLSSAQWVIVMLLTAVVLQQTVTPLRYLTSPGNPEWTGHGFFFGWRMKLRQKSCQIEGTLHDPRSGVNSSVNFDAVVGQRYRVTNDPDRAIQLAHYLAEEHARLAGAEQRPEVYFRLWCSMNGRKAQVLIPPTVNLAAVDWRREPFDFVTPLRPLRRAEEARLPWNWTWELVQDLWLSFLHAGDELSPEEVAAEQLAQEEALRLRAEKQQQKASERLQAAVQQRLHERQQKEQAPAS
mmetsp:Transcript_19612/g.75278  ORF Transcript_19612/g.75278 Transcript_19612/m.75278 type:complete len:567 (-) Transcript_19612:179-1879(-)